MKKKKKKKQRRRKEVSWRNQQKRKEGGTKLHPITPDKKRALTASDEKEAKKKSTFSFRAFTDPVPLAKAQESSARLEPELLAQTGVSELSLQARRGRA